MTVSRFVALVFLSAIAVITTSTSVRAADGPSFSKVIGPLLTNHCAKCHGATRQKNDLRLDTAEGVKKGGKNGLIFIAGKPDESPIYQRTTKPPGDKDRMPAQGELLTKKQTDLIKAWIEAGAKFD
jgi:mono/diheme cytochrome c family protein